MGFGRYLVIIFYTGILIYYIGSLKSSTGIGKFKNSNNSVPAQIQILGQFRYHFFTVWIFILQTIFVLIAVLDESSKLLSLPLTLQKSLGRSRAFLFNTLVFPCSLVVVTVFWTIWHIDRELIFPRVIDPIFPSWLNHTMHTFIVVPLLIELALPKKYSFVSFKNAAVVLTVYVTVYQVLYLSVYLRYGVWLYGIYGVLNWTQRVLFSLFQLTLCLAYQKIGIVIQNSKRKKYTEKIA